MPAARPRARWPLLLLPLLLGAAAAVQLRAGELPPAEDENFCAGARDADDDEAGSKDWVWLREVGCRRCQRRRRSATPPCSPNRQLPTLLPTLAPPVLVSNTPRRSSRACRMYRRRW